MVCVENIHRTVRTCLDPGREDRDTLKSAEDGTEKTEMFPYSRHEHMSNVLENSVQPPFFGNYLTKKEVTQNGI